MQEYRIYIELSFNNPFMLLILDVGDIGEAVYGRAMYKLTSLSGCLGGSTKMLIYLI